MILKTVNITPMKLSGEVHIPPSKSIGHRAIICGGLSQGTTKIENLGKSHDMEATLEGMQSLGAKIERINTSTIKITGMNFNKEGIDIINCKESGSTIRFLIPLAGLFNKAITFTGEGRLGERPLIPYYEIFDKQNISYTTDNGNLPLEIKGYLKPDNFYLKGNISSQFITGLLFALPLLDGDSTIHITTELESKGYIDLTLDILKDFSINIKNDDYKTFYIKGNQTYMSQDYTIEGDFSQAAFWIVAGLIGEELTIKGLNSASHQGDKMILEIVQNMGGNVIIESNHIQVKPSQTIGTTIDVSQCPDLVPVLAVLASVSKGTTKIINASRLRIKESDRLKSTATELNKLGAHITETEDSLIIQGKEQLKGGCSVDSWNDHRIAMALAIASIKCNQPIEITNSDAVKKSYPSFWEDFKNLGGNLK